MYRPFNPTEHMTMKVNGMFSIVRAGFVMPAPLVELAIKQFPTTLGTVYLDPEEGLCVNYYDLKKDVESVDNFMTMQENFKDNLKAYWFAKAESPIPADSMQPFVVLKKDGKDVVVALLAGDYEKWREQDEKDQTDAFHMVNGVLRPKLAKMYTKLCGEDTKKLFDELKGTDTDRTEEASIVAFAQHRGCIGLIFDHGDYLCFDIRNEDYGIPNADWGYSTDRLGWNPDAKPKETTTEKAKKAMFDVAHKIADTVSLTKRNSIDKANASEAAIAAATVDDKNDIPANSDPKFFPPAYLSLKEKDGKVYLQCPKELINKDERRTWHVMWTTGVVNGYKKVDNPPYAEANQDFLDWKAGKLKTFKDMRAAGVQTVERKPVREAPIITPEKRKSLAAYIQSGEAKAKAEQGRVLNADDLKEPRKIALFTAQMAEDVGSLEDTFRWDEEYLTEIQKREPIAMVLLAMEYRDQLMRLLVAESPPPANANDKVTAKVEETKVTEPPKGEKKKKFMFAN